ncbi:MAG: hypothetical protein MK179_13465 [Pirellulaceae bacterium]|nr:hypothetical protein [Pirellulaceae bacterium]
MNSVDWTAKSVRDESPFGAAPDAELGRVDRVFAISSEFLNPILVKEGRQAFKSFQFFFTFLLLLLIGWVWSVFGVSCNMPGIYYVPAGPMMIVGYLWILSFPLLVVIPFASFLSLARERNDGTFELVSITTLSPLQIIVGKLGSSVVQMLIYLSALSPCLAFTYLLRGIDILTILVLMLYVFAGSIGLSAVGLLLATMAVGSTAQGFLMVALGGGLLFCFFVGCITGTQLVLFGAFSVGEFDFWIIQLCAFSFFVVLGMLVCLAAAARIAPVGENRSTRLRSCMLLANMIIAGWCAYFTARSYDEDVVMGFIIQAAMFWYAMGVFMTCESPVMSERVKRSLPVTSLGRVLFTWFNPGPGTGYMFAVGNVVAMTVWAVGVMVVVQVGKGGTFDVDVFVLGLICSAYVVLYLGLIRLVIAGIRRFVSCGMLWGSLLHMVFLLGGTACALGGQWGILYEFNYSPLQIANPFWTTFKAAEGNILVYTAPILPGVPVVPVMLVTGAILVFVLNLFSVVDEMRYKHKEAPERVLADELELHPQPEKVDTATNPWDQPEG